jgi:hypothetical protein
MIARRRAARTLLALAGLLALLGGAAGCAMNAVQTVPAWQRELLVDRTMSFKAEAREEARKMKSYEAREGSTGGAGGAGGGCACN